MLEILIIVLVIAVLLPHLGVVMPEPMGKILGVILFVILLFWLLQMLNIAT
jgi:hypothetical protein